MTEQDIIRRFNALDDKIKRVICCAVANPSISRIGIVDDVGQTYTASLSDDTLSADVGGLGDITITLPDPSTALGKIYTIKRYDNTSTGTVNITSASGSVQSNNNGIFTGSVNLSLWTVYRQKIVLQSNGTNWESIG